MSPAATTASARPPARDRAPGLRLPALDVDGTLTHGAILIGPQGAGLEALPRLLFPSDSADGLTSWSCHL